VIEIISTFDFNHRRISKKGINIKVKKVNCEEEMKMNNIESLTGILKRMNAGESLENIKNETKDLLEKINPTELSLAEQKLIEEGMKPEELRGLCVIHMEMLKGNLEKLKAAVEPDHPLQTLIAEHEKLLGFLNQLDMLNFALQDKGVNNITAEDIEQLKNLAEQIISAENHHLREENALFPELEKLGITGPTRIMRLEHNELRARKRTLLDLASNFNTSNEDESLKGINEAAKYIVFNLRDHIFKENHILYPSALENIEETIWSDIKEKCDEIGYCPFTSIRKCEGGSCSL
jgi:uncharacterized protein